MAIIDHREIIYKKIFNLDTLDKNYYNNFFNLMGLLLDPKEREELSNMIVNIRMRFIDSSGQAPNFYRIQWALHETRLNGRKFLQVGVGSSRRRVEVGILEEDLQDMIQWCFEKLYNLQKTIRFSSVDNALA